MDRYIFIGSIIVLFLLLWYIYPKLYMPSIFSSYTPNEEFPISDLNAYQKLASDGFVIASETRVVIAGLVRDVEKKMPDIKQKVERVGALFADYRVLLVENDS